MIDQQAVKKRWHKVQRYYAEHNQLQIEIAKRLAARLPYMKIAPKVIVDLAAREKTTQALLQQHYPNAQIITLPFGEPLDKFPIETASVDLVFANLALHWSADMFKTLAECRRILKKDGLLLFSTVGPDTLKELHTAFLTAEEKWHVHAFMDMHHIGDELVRLQFFEPVMDMEILQLRYESLRDLFEDLKNSGTANAWPARSRGLQGKVAWQKMLAHYASLQQDNLYPVTIECVYGQAWVAGPRLAVLNNNNEATFSLDDLQVLNRSEA